MQEEKKEIIPPKPSHPGIKPDPVKPNIPRKIPNEPGSPTETPVEVPNRPPKEIPIKNPNKKAPLKGLF